MAKKGGKGGKGQKGRDNLRTPNRMNHKVHQDKKNVFVSEYDWFSSCSLWFIGSFG
jgi:hypothetical protein